MWQNIRSCFPCIRDSEKVFSLSSLRSLSQLSRATCEKKYRMVVKIDLCYSVGVDTLVNKHFLSALTTHTIKYLGCKNRFWLSQFRAPEASLFSSSVHFFRSPPFNMRIYFDFFKEIPKDCQWSELTCILSPSLSLSLSLSLSVL